MSSLGLREIQLSVSVSFDCEKIAEGNTAISRKNIIDLLMDSGANVMVSFRSSQEAEPGATLMRQIKNYF